jgi:N utilization substance protein A
MSREILEAMHALAREKGIASETLMHALEDALLSAYKKQLNAAKYARVQMDPETGDYRVIELIIPERLEAHLIVETIDEGTTYDPETGEMVEPTEPEIDPAKFEEYKDQIAEQDVTPDDFGRIAAQTAKQVILQRIREAERDMMFEEYQDRVGELVTGIVQQKDARYTLIQLRERVEALLPKSEQVDGERYEHNQRVKAVIKEVSPSTKGPSIIVSRRDPELIKKLFELEVPEIADGLVEIANVAREPGYRSKIAVVSYADGVDPVGACVGPRGSRVRMVVSELRGEKIDIIPYNDEPARFVAKALSPARVREVLVDDEGRQATVVVPDDQLSLAIGREGQNARLAARLTGWRIDIRSETEFATEETEQGYEEETEQGGRCAAILANGRRCPNSTLPGTRYCGLDAHQALTDQPTDYVNGPPEPGAGGGAEGGSFGPDGEDVIDELPTEVGEAAQDVVSEDALAEGPLAGEVPAGEVAAHPELSDDDAGLEPDPGAATPDGGIDVADVIDPAAEPAAQEPSS